MAFLPVPFSSVTARQETLACRPGHASPTMKSKRRGRGGGSSPSTVPSGDGGGNGKRSPARINVESTTLSVRQQLSLVRQYAAHQQEREHGNRPRERTSFRRKKDDLLSRRRNAALDADIPDGKYDLTTDPLIFIDGYNVIGCWPKLRKWRDRGDLETARRLLLEDVAEFSAVRGWECIAVFDALGTGKVYLTSSILA